MASLNETIAKNIRKRLAELNEKQGYLSEKLGTTRESVSMTLKNLADGKSITTKKLEEIAKALGLQTEELLKE